MGESLHLSSAIQLMAKLVRPEAFQQLPGETSGNRNRYGLEFQPHPNIQHRHSVTQFSISTEFFFELITG